MSVPSSAPATWVVVELNGSSMRKPDMPTVSSVHVFAALACFFAVPVLAAQTTQSHIHAVETGLGPAVTIKGRPAEHRELLAEMNRLHIPAVSVAMIHGGRLEWAKGYGTQSKGSHPVTAKTLFQAASLSKSLTAMAALKLVEQRKLALDAPVGTELKSWALPQTSITSQTPVTLRELLSHTAGTSVHGFAGYPAGDPVPTLVQVLNGTKPANSDPIVVRETPGTRFSYSGGGYTIVQEMMVDQSAKTFPELMKDLVLRPIGMKNSTFKQPLSKALLRKAAMPVDSQGRPIPGGPHTYPEMAAAGLWTTPSDLAQWVIEVQRSLAGERNHVLSAEMVRTMLTPVKDGYALGVGVEAPSGKPILSHTGGNEGYRCIYFAYQNGDGAVIMTNSDGGDALFGELLGSIAREYGWPDYLPEERTLASSPLSQQLQFGGDFQIKDGPRITITAAKTLQLSIDGGPPKNLLPSSATSFFVLDDIMQLGFDDPDRGAVIFGKRRDHFTRVEEAPKL